MNVLMLIMMMMIMMMMIWQSIYLPVIFFMCPFEISSSSFGIWVQEKDLKDM